MNYSNDFLLGIQLAYIVLGILTATFIGSVSCGIWLLLSKGAAKFYVKDAMKYMRLILACFIVPMTPFVLYPLIKNWVILPGPYMVRSMTEILVIVLGVWLVSVIFMVLQRLYNYVLVCGICKYNIPVEDETILGQIEIWKKALGITQKVNVSLNANVSSPSILYHWGYQILLPAYEMTEKEMSMAVLHELVHLKHKDIWVKDACFMVNVIHGFNPIIWHIKEHVVKWAEVLCDITTCEVGKGSFSKQEYYYGIIGLMKNAEMEMRSEAIFALSESKSLLEFRVEKFAEAGKQKQKNLKVVLYVVFAFMVLVTGLGFYVTTSATNAWYEASLMGNGKQEVMTEPREQQKTTYEQMLSDSNNKHTEYYAFEDNLDVKKQLGAENIWYIHIEKEGIQSVTTHIFTDATAYMLGCVDENGNVIYIDTKEDWVEHFECQKNIEAIFIKNNGAVDVEFDIAVVVE